jgi:[CysO sulfur-carrier protein]-S-L-cysteine hydrolase
MDYGNLLPLEPFPNPPLLLNTAQWQQMRRDVIQRAPEEACGLLLGQNVRILEVVAATNTYHSPVRFQIDAQEQLNAFLRMEEMGWELCAIYHSHPAGPPHPSATDIAETFYPEAISIIWWRQDEVWQAGGFRIFQNTFQPAPLKISDNL